jgi:hypothetical protein
MSAKAQSIFSHAHRDPYKKFGQQMRMVIALVIALNRVPSEVTTIKCVTNSSEFDCHPETGQSIAFKQFKMSALVVQLLIASRAIGTEQHQCTNKRSRRITSVYPSDIRRIQG